MPLKMTSTQMVKSLWENIVLYLTVDPSSATQNCAWKTQYKNIVNVVIKMGARPPMSGRETNFP